MVVTRERIRQIETKAFDTIRGRRGRVLAELVDDGRTIGERRPHASTRAIAESRESPEPPTERHREDDDYTAGRKISFFAEGEGADQLVSDMVWRLFAKDSTARGFDARSAASRRQSEWRKNNPLRGPQFVAFAKKKTKETKPMPLPTQMTPRLERVLAIYESGATLPSTISAKLKGEMSPANVSMALSALRRLGKVPPGQPGGKGGAKPMPPRVNPRRAPDVLPPAEDVVVPVPVFVDEPAAPRPPLVAPVQIAAGSPAVVETASPLARLRSELAACEKRSGAIRTAIAVLEEGGVT